jgi:ribonuclease HI
MKIYTDGSCYVSNKKGTWAFIAILDEYTELHSSGFSNDTTNNIMEVSAILNALKTFPTRNDIEIYSDSMYAINCAQNIWQRKKNVELWNEYDRIVNKR